LVRVLYGLHCSPKLWQNDLTTTLLSLGLRQIPEQPYLFTTTKSIEPLDLLAMATATSTNPTDATATGIIIVFFYVDDIILLYKLESQLRECMAEIKAKLCEHYEMRDLGEISWFLRILVLYDRQKRKLWLVQDSYMDTLAAKFNLEHAAKALTPVHVTARNFIPHQQNSSPNEILPYQKKIGSAIYPGVITCPDIAYAAGLLACLLAFFKTQLLIIKLKRTA
jgi:hypothetical protein